MSVKHPTYDFCILGAGIAGLSLASSLREKNFNVIVIDNKGIAAGASGTPVGMVNPSSGRWGKLVWRAQECYEAISKLLKEVQAQSNRVIFKNNGVLHPALDPELADGMKEVYDDTNWPAGWCEWLSEEEIKKFHPGITCVEGGQWLPIALTVDMDLYMQTLAKMLKKQGVHIEVSPVYHVELNNERWQIKRHRHPWFKAKNLIYANGIHANENIYWRDLPLHPVKGQIAVYEKEDGLGFDHSLSSQGYMAHLNGRKFVMGSTYEHQFDYEEPDKKGEKKLRKKLLRTLPHFRGQISLKDRWAGIRVSTPNRMPFIGHHPSIPNLHVFTGLGSKGLLYGKFISNLYVNYLINGQNLPRKIDVRRYYKN